MSPTPFAMVMSELWATLIDCPQLVRLVKDKNRIRFDRPDDHDPVKRDTITASDLPEITIIPSSGSANLLSTSSSSQITRQYQILISSGDYRYEFVSQVEWLCFCAMASWKNRLSALAWKGNTFVKRVNVPSTAGGLSDPAENRNIKGWSAVWTIEVEMHFTTSDLIEEISEIESLSN